MVWGDSNTLTKLLYFKLSQLSSIFELIFLLMNLLAYSVHLVIIGILRIIVELHQLWTWIRFFRSCRRLLDDSFAVGELDDHIIFVDIGTVGHRFQKIAPFAGLTSLHPELTDLLLRLTEFGNWIAALKEWFGFRGWIAVEMFVVDVDLRTIWCLSLRANRELMPFLWALQRRSRDRFEFHRLVFRLLLWKFLQCRSLLFGESSVRGKWILGWMVLGHLHMVDPDTWLRNLWLLISDKGGIDLLILNIGLLLLLHERSTSISKPLVRQPLLEGNGDGVDGLGSVSSILLLLLSCELDLWCWLQDSRISATEIYIQNNQINESLHNQIFI